MLTSAPSRCHFEFMYTHTQSRRCPPNRFFLDAQHPQPSGLELKNRACCSICSETPAVAPVGGSRGQGQPCPCLTAGFGTSFHSCTGLTSSWNLVLAVHMHVHTHTHTHQGLSVRSHEDRSGKRFKQV